MTALYPNHNYVVFDTIQESAADLVLSNGVFSLGNPLAELCKYDDIAGSKVTTAVAETTGVRTNTITAVASTTYSFYIQQLNPTTGRLITQFLNYTSLASGDTDETISNAFRARIDALTAAGALFIDTSGTTTLVLEAQAGYPVFTVTPVDAASSQSWVNTTPGVAPVGTLAQLALEGITVTGAAYTKVSIWFAPKSGQNVKNPIGVQSQVDIYLNEAATNFAALAAAFNYLLDGREVSVGGPANPEAISHTGV